MAASSSTGMTSSAGGSGGCGSMSAVRQKPHGSSLRHPKSMANHDPPPSSTPSTTRPSTNSTWRIAGPTVEGRNEQLSLVLELVIERRHASTCFAHDLKACIRLCC